MTQTGPAVAPPPQPRPVSLRRQMFRFFLVLLPTLFCGYLVYRDDLGQQLIHDDIGILLYFDHGHKITWGEAFAPLNNGFFRPATIVLFKAIYQQAGTEAWPYRLTSLLIHVVVSALAWWLAYNIRPREAADQARLAALLTVFAAGSYPVVYLLSNSCDSLLAVGTLVALTGWVRFLDVPRWRYLLLTALGVALGILSKETSMVMGFVLAPVAWAFAPRWPRRVQIATAVFILVSLAQLGWVLWLQGHSDSSYTSTGARDLHPGRAMQRLLLYMASAVWPPAYTIDATPGTLWLRPIAAALAGLALLASAGVVMLKRGTTAAKIAVLVLSAAAFLAPISILKQDYPMTRFAYVPTALLFVAVVVAAQRWLNKGWLQVVPMAAATLYMFAQVPMIHRSATLRDYVGISREWRNFIHEIRRLQPVIPPMSYIVVHSGPQYGSYPLATNYGGTLFRVYFPGMLANFYGNEVPPEATMAFTFDGEKLTSAPLSR